MLTQLSRHARFLQRKITLQVSGASGPGDARAGDARSWILANHRMPAYRARALAMCLSALPMPQAAASEINEQQHIQLSDSLIPKSEVYSVVARTAPHPPAESIEQASSRCHLPSAQLLV